MPSKRFRLSAFLCLCATFAMSPDLLSENAVAQSAADGALIEQGRQVFLTAGEVGCAACHGPYAEGDVGIGPYNRGLGEAAIRSSLEGIDEMEFLLDEMTDQDIRAIAAYYEYLGTLQLEKALVKRGRFVPDSIDVYPGTRIQLVLTNASTKPRNFAGESAGIDFTVPGRESGDVVWTAPQDEGEHRVVCTDCRIKDGLVINVTKSAKRMPGAEEFVASAEQVVSSPAASVDLGLSAKGREVFLTAGGVGCVACHGPYAEGDVGIGPYNRGMDEAAIRRALAESEEMAFLQDELSDSEIEQVAAYYAALGKQMLVKTRLVRGRFVPDTIRVEPNAKIQLVIDNRGPEIRRIVSDDLQIATLSVPARASQDLVWTAPASSGSYMIRCTDCTAGDKVLTVVVDNNE